MNASPDNLDLAVKPGSDLQDADEASLGAEVEAGLPRAVSGVDVGSQVDQIRHHQVVVVHGGVEEGGLWGRGRGGQMLGSEAVIPGRTPGSPSHHHSRRVWEVQAVEVRHPLGDAVAQRPLPDARHLMQGPAGGKARGGFTGRYARRRKPAKAHSRPAASVGVQEHGVRHAPQDTLLFLQLRPEETGSVEVPVGTQRLRPHLPMSPGSCTAADLEAAAHPLGGGEDLLVVGARDDLVQVLGGGPCEAPWRPVW